MTLFLFSLPAELRNQIYKYLLITDEFIMTRVHDCETFERPDGIRHSLRLHPSILRTSQQIYKEACQILYGENFFILPQWPPDLENFHKGNRYTPPCAKHSHLPHVTRIRKLHSASAHGDYLLTQGLLHFLRPNDPGLALQWKPFPLMQINEIFIGFGRTKSSGRGYRMMKMKLFLGFNPDRLKELLAEWYMQGGLTIAFSRRYETEDGLTVFRRVIEEKYGREIKGVGRKPKPSLRSLDDEGTDDEGTDDEGIDEEDESGRHVIRRTFKSLPRAKDQV